MLHQPLKRFAFATDKLKNEFLFGSVAEKLHCRHQHLEIGDQEAQQLKQFSLLGVVLLVSNKEWYCWNRCQKVCKLQTSVKLLNYFVMNSYQFCCNATISTWIQTRSISVHSDISRNLKQNLKLRTVSAFCGTIFKVILEILKFDLNLNLNNRGIRKFVNHTSEKLLSDNFILFRNELLLVLL